MAWTLTIAGQNLQGYVRPFKSLKVKHRGYLGSGTLSARLVDKETTPGSGVYNFTINNEDDVTLVDASVTTFVGRVRRRTRKDLNTAGIRVWEIECQDFNADPSDDWVPVGTGPRTVAETDKARLAWLFSTYGTHSIDASTSVTQNIQIANLPNQDFQGMTLAQAVDEICKLTGGSWYIDYQKRLHYFVTEATAAPFSINVQSPNNTTTFPCRDFEYPDDSIDYVNTVQVVGAGVTATRYEGGSPPPAGKQRLLVLTDSSLLTVDACQKAGDAVLTKQGKKQDGKLVVWRAGLFPGMMLPIVNSQWGINSSFLINGVEPDYVDLNTAFYTVSFGSEPQDLASLWQKNVIAISNVTALSEATAGNVGVDTTAPNPPTGLYLQTSQEQGPDGSLTSVIIADWDDNVEADLDAYELQMERALTGAVIFTASASGTGGALAAGTYRLFVTGVGAVQGETARQTGATLVTITAGQRLFVNITAKQGCPSYKVYAQRVDNPGLSMTTATTGTNVEVTPEGSGAGAPETSNALSFIAPQTVRSVTSITRVPAALAGTYYGARVRAVDKAANYSGWSNIGVITSAKDATAPDIPTSLAAIPGFRLVGLAWEPVSATDLDRYEVRWAPDKTGAPDTDNWEGTAAYSTSIVIQDLSPGVTYYFQIRAVDRSNNVRTSVADPTAVDASANPEAGWSNLAGSYLTSVPVSVGQADIAANSIVSSMISTLGLDASVIKSGFLKVGGSGTDPYSDKFLVYDSVGRLVFQIDENGMFVYDPASANANDGFPRRRMRFLNGVLQFSNSDPPLYSTSVSPDGIDAASIKFGKEPGGSNMVPNSGFEMATFTLLQTKLWSSAADWGATIGTDVNLVKTGTELRLSDDDY